MFTMIMVAAGYIDLRYRKIPTMIILLLFLYALLWSPVSAYERITGFFIGAVPMFCIASATDKIKGGDVKFMAVFGAAAGLIGFVQTLLFTSIYATIYTLLTRKNSVPLAFFALLGWVSLKCVMSLK